MERRRYDQARAIRHAGLGLIRAPQVGAVFEALEEICGSNRQDGDGVRPAVGLNALPGLGKTTAAPAFGRALAASRGCARSPGWRSQASGQGWGTPRRHPRTPHQYRTRRSA
jgi:hypothetical protein